MVAYLLPGLRHARTPLVAGALWVLIVWLIFGNGLVPDATGGRIESLLHDLGVLVGRHAVLAGLALLATLIGGMTPRLPVGLIARNLPINQGGRWWQVPLCRSLGLEPDLAEAQGEFNNWLFRRVIWRRKGSAGRSLPGGTVHRSSKWLPAIYKSTGRLASAANA